jgi:hypothetical protein
MLFGLLWNSLPLLFSVPQDCRRAQQAAPGFPACKNLVASEDPCPHGIAKAPCETQWKIGTFVQVFRASISFKALYNPSCY